MKKGLNMTMAEALAHQKKHGFMGDDTVPTKTIEKIGNKFLQINDGMNKTERAFSRILEVQKARSEIVEWRYQGIRLPWGRDPKSGRAMYYKPDFYVVSYALHGPKDSEEKHWIICVKIIEVKGGHIWDRDKVRFRGCRAEWPMFQFELWQKKEGQWRRLE